MLVVFVAETARHALVATVLQTVSKCTMSVVCAQARGFLRALAIVLAKSTTVLEFVAA